jgi:hypothetical protein
MAEESAFLSATCDIPETRRVVIRSREKLLPTFGILREVNTQDSIRVRCCLVCVVAKLLCDSFARFGIPNLDVSVNGVVTPSGDPLSV